MKRLATMMAALMLAMSMAACASNTVTPAGSDAGSGSAAVDSSGGSDTGEEVIIGESAWQDSGDSDAAAEGAGITEGFTLPETLPIGEYEWSEPNFTYMDNVVQADYDGVTVACSIRKGEGVPIDELSADLNDYQFEWTQTVNGIEVTCHGYEENIANFLEWETDGCSYDVWCVGVQGDNIGMSESEVTAMVESIK